MKQKISKSNPFSLNAHGHFWEYLNKNGSSNLHLDFGTNSGLKLNEYAKSKVIKSAIGVDAQEDIVKKYQHLLSSQVTLQPIKVGAPLPFNDRTFDSSSIFGVLEHVLNQEQLLQEVRRVTKCGGLLVVSVPGKHLFSFLDMGNWKFIFPRAHKFIYSLIYGNKAYEIRYEKNPFGLHGDIEKEKGWHQHFSKSELETILTNNGFEVIEIDGCGFFQRVFANIMFFFPGRLKIIIKPFIFIDAYLFSSTEIWAICKRA